MKILSIDPSLTCVGWAIFDRYTSKLLHVGRIIPGASTKPLHERLNRIAEGLTDLPHEQFNRVVIEVPSSHVGKKRHKGGGAGLARYGVAVGYVIGVTRQLGDPALILENDWTEGVPKDKRSAITRRLVPKLKDIPDPGGDIADAVGLGQWWLHHNRVRLTRSDRPARRH